MVRVTVAEPLTGGVTEELLKMAEAPVGRPVTERLTVPEKL